MLSAAASGSFPVRRTPFPGADISMSLAARRTSQEIPLQKPPVVQDTIPEVPAVVIPEPVKVAAPPALPGEGGNKLNASVITRSVIIAALIVVAVVVAYILVRPK